MLSRQTLKLFNDKNIIGQHYNMANSDVHVLMH